MPRSLERWTLLVFVPRPAVRKGAAVVPHQRVCLQLQLTSSPMVRSVNMDLAVGESAGTSSPRPSGGENDEAKKFEEVSFIDGVLQGPQAREGQGGLG